MKRKLKYHELFNEYYKAGGRNSWDGVTITHDKDGNVVEYIDERYAAGEEEKIDTTGNGVADVVYAVARAKKKREKMLSKLAQLSELLKSRYAHMNVWITFVEDVCEEANEDKKFKLTKEQKIKLNDIYKRIR